MKTRTIQVNSYDLVALLERYRAGDKAAYVVLDKACRRRVHNWLRRALPSVKLRAECDDAVQESLVQLVFRSDSFPADQKLIAWLKKTAKRKATNAHRRRRPRANSRLIASLGETG